MAAAARNQWLLRCWSLLYRPAAATVVVLWTIRLVLPRSEARKIRQVVVVVVHDGLRLVRLRGLKELVPAVPRCDCGSVWVHAPESSAFWCPNSRPPIRPECRWHCDVLHGRRLDSCLHRRCCCCTIAATCRPCAWGELLRPRVHCYHRSGAISGHHAAAAADGATEPCGGVPPASDGFRLRRRLELADDGDGGGCC